MGFLQKYLPLLYLYAKPPSLALLVYHGSTLNRPCCHSRLVEMVAPAIVYEESVSHRQIDATCRCVYYPVFL